MTPSTKAELKKRMIRDKMREWASKHGNPPRACDWKQVRGTSWPSYLTVVRHFGSWDKGIRSAGFKPRGRGRPLL